MKTTLQVIVMALALSGLTALGQNNGNHNGWNGNNNGNHNGQNGLGPNGGINKVPDGGSTLILVSLSFAGLALAGTCLGKKRVRTA